MKIQIIGGRNQLTRYLAPRLLSAGHAVAVSSRGPRPEWIQSHGMLTWEREPTDRADALAIIAPLDLVAGAIARMGGLRHVLAFSSMSVLTKRESAYSADRALAARLATGERVVLAAAQAGNVTVTILRPTLIYGCGMDRNLTAVAQFIDRRGWFPLCGSATGLRQPVLAADLACAAERALLKAIPGTFAVGGGEALPYQTMIERVFMTLDRSPQWRRLPPWAVRSAGRAATRLGLGSVAGRCAILERMEQDLDVDNAPAQRALEYRPAGFAPNASAWGLALRTS